MATFETPFARGDEVKIWDAGPSQEHVFRHSLPWVLPDAGGSLDVRFLDISIRHPIEEQLLVMAKDTQELSFQKILTISPSNGVVLIPDYSSPESDWTQAPRIQVTHSENHDRVRPRLLFVKYIGYSGRHVFATEEVVA
jgi:hypothetical protein